MGVDGSSGAVGWRGDEVREWDVECGCGCEEEEEREAVKERRIRICASIWAVAY
jgi:hypothetical protein